MVNARVTDFDNHQQHQSHHWMGITSLIGKLFGADVAPPPDAARLHGTSEAALARSLSALSPDERGWITFAEARILFSNKDDQYAFGETDDASKADRLAAT
jgi:hypothetical protein